MKIATGKTKDNEIGRNNCGTIAVGTIAVKGLVNQVKGAIVVGTIRRATTRIVGKISWSHIPGLVYIDVVCDAQEPYMTVPKVVLDKPVARFASLPSASRIITFPRRVPRTAFANRSGLRRCSDGAVVFRKMTRDFGTG